MNVYFWNLQFLDCLVPTWTRGNHIWITAWIQNKGKGRSLQQEHTKYRLVSKA